MGQVEPLMPLCPPGAPVRCRRVKDEGIPFVKKLIALAVVLAGGFGIWRRFQQDRAERDLWTEATSASGRS